MLAPGGEVDRPSPLAAMALGSLQLYPSYVADLTRDSGLPIDFQTCGALELAFTSSELFSLHNKALQQNQLAIVSKSLTPKQVKTFWPNVNPTQVVGGRFYPQDATVDPRDLASALLVACRKLDVAVVEDCQLHGVTVDSTDVTVEVASYGKKTFGAVVIAAGAWSNRISVSPAVPPLPAVEPVKGVLIAYPQPEQTCATIIRSGHSYVLQRANGLLIAGASVEHVGFERQIRPEIVTQLESEAARILPHLAETSPSQVWAGFRPSAPELCLGPWHSPRLYLAYGHYRNGILLAPWTAAEIVRMVSANLGTP